MERPSIKQYLKKNTTVKDVNDMFINNKELYNYIQSLDNYVDYLEEKLNGDKNPEASAEG